MEEDNLLDMRHLIRLADENDEHQEGWKDYSSSSMTIEQDMETYLDGKAKRRLRRLQERKLNKLKNK